MEAEACVSATHESELGRAEGVGEGGRECYWEWLVGPDHCREWLVDELGDELVLGAWRAFLAALPPGEGSPLFSNPLEDQHAKARFPHWVTQNCL